MRIILYRAHTISNVSLEISGMSEQSLISHSTHIKSFRGRVFPANHLAMVLTNQTYNTGDKHKIPKDIHTGTRNPKN